jgi:trk/ktr system potassium uptake protein
MSALKLLSIAGFMSMLFSATLILPAAVSYWYNDGELVHFLYPMFIMFSIGFLLWPLSRKESQKLKTRDGFLIVVLLWIGLSMLAAIPLSLGTNLSYHNAIFEAVSAVTTTGATVITGLDDLPRSILFYRQLLQWLGGMGMIVLAVAILPMLGIGGMQLYKAEAPGPLKDDKMTPRLAQSARILWEIYLVITVANALAYWFAGMTPFDAIAHSLSTVSTGGFSTHDASLGYFDSTAIDIIAIVFMLLGAINFGVHYMVIHNKNPLLYIKNEEVSAYLLFSAFIILLTSYILYSSGTYNSFGEAFRDSAFEVVSVVTSTGFGTVDFSHWPDILPVLLIFISFVGGCGGSTAGGMKVMRIMLLIRQGWREVRLLIHPHAIIPIVVSGRLIENRIISTVWGFFAAYIATFMILMLWLMHTGVDQVTAFSAIATCMNNMGPGLGEVAYTFTSISDAGKTICMVAMLMGRLEIFTILVILSPEYWRG